MSFTRLWNLLLQYHDVLLSGVNFATGQAFDVARLTEAAHRAGAAALWDLAHAAGNVELALHDWGVDAAAWCTVCPRQSTRAMSFSVKGFSGAESITSRSLRS